MGRAEDSRRRGEASARPNGHDEAIGSDALRRRQQPASTTARGLTNHALAQPGRQLDFSTRHDPSGNHPPHHQHLLLLGCSSRCHPALVPSTHNRLDSVQPVDGRPAALDLDLDLDLFSSSSKPTLAFAVAQQRPTTLPSSALTTPSALVDFQIPNFADTSSASQSSRAASSVHSRTDHLPPIELSTKMATASAVAPQGISSDSFYAAHLRDQMPAVRANPDLPILNAQQYELGGPTSTDDSEVTPKKSNKPTNKGKRRRPSAEADAAGEDGAEVDDNDGPRKRSRGRPRLDTKDETAADRRRTQIRLAQRAYRNRKDTAITTLEQKVKELEEANQRMSRGFNDVYETIVAERMLDSAPHAAHRLKSIASKFLASAADTRSTIGSSETQSSDADDENLSSYPLQRDTAESSSSSDTRRTHPWQRNQPCIPQPNIHMPSSLSHEIVTEPTPDNASFPFYASMEQGSRKYLAQFSPTQYGSLPSPSSYAAHEVTFGRRFQRANLEAGLRLISMPNPPPQRYAAVFGFCLFFESRESIIRRLMSSLRRTQLETLNHWRSPFTNLGGSGTFFVGDKAGSMSSGESSDSGSLPIGNQGTLEYGKPQELTGFSMGPFSAEVETTRDERLDHRLRMVLPGFEGDFFDADEIETYLRRLGIVIPQSADFVEAEINIADLEDETTPVPQGLDSVGAGRQGAFAAAGLYSPDSMYGNVNGPVAGGMWPGDSPDVGKQGSGADMVMTMPSMGPALNAGGMSVASDLPDGLAAFMYQSGLDGMWGVASNVQRSKISIDVNVLVTELVSSSVCLGRSPGVRRRDVNKAVKVAAGMLSMR